MRHRRARLALPDRPSRSVGLRSAGRADPRRHHRRRAARSRPSCSSPSRRLRSCSIASTGQPVWPIEERPVPTSDTPGERTSPTQPFPTKPPPFERQGVAIDDLIDFTPELRAEALELVKQYQDRPAVHAAVDSRRRAGRHEGHGAAAGLGRRRGLAGRRVRSGHAACSTCRRSRRRSSPTSSRAIPTRTNLDYVPGRARVSAGTAGTAAAQAAVRPHHGDRPEHGRHHVDGGARRRPARPSAAEAAQPAAARQPRTRRPRC